MKTSAILSMMGMVLAQQRGQQASRWQPAQEGLDNMADEALPPQSTLGAGPGDRGEQASRWEPAQEGLDNMNDNAMPMSPASNLGAGPGDRGEQATRWEPAQQAQDRMNDNAIPTLPTDDWDEVDEQDEEALQGYYYRNWDPLSVVMRWMPDRATMDACDTGADGHDETEMLDCVLDNASWWASYYIPYYFPWVFNEYDADDDDLISSAEMDALYEEIARREMVWALMKIDQDIPELGDCTFADPISPTKAECGACWKANVSWWRRYYFDYWFDIVWAWFDADEDDVADVTEWEALNDEIARIKAWSHLFRIRRYLPDDGFDSCTFADAAAPTKTEVSDCWIANVPYWKEYYFPYHFNSVWAYFDADEDDVLDADEETALLEASEARVLMGV